VGNEIMGNLKSLNIYRDNGSLSKNKIKKLEKDCGVCLPRLYAEFISDHNGARFSNNCFNFYDCWRQGNSCESMAFLDLRKIKDDMESLLEQSTSDPNDPDIFKFYEYFDENLIPFGETGGGDFICFDYRESKDACDPPIIYWCHDANEPDERISFIANNFEKFINMLHEPED
jgi:hypothetical protein